MTSLSDEEYLRYSRHIMLRHVDEAGQQIFKQAHVVIVGLGGLGCPAAQYLCASGVGRLTLIDADTVSLSNLQRQILFTHNDVGSAKVQVAKAQLQKQNPFVQINAIEAKVQEAQFDTLLSEVDVVLDCTDNPHSRQFINSHCVRRKRKLVSGAAIQGQGQLLSFDFSQPDPPCYQCLFPDLHTTPAQNCLDTGVLSPLLGVIGSMQAVEALNLLLQKSQHINKLSLFDAFGLRLKQIQLKKSLSCPCC